MPFTFVGNFLSLSGLKYRYCKLEAKNERCMGLGGIGLSFQNLRQVPQFFWGNMINGELGLN
jgi:hypothetical protein